MHFSTVLKHFSQIFFHVMAAFLSNFSLNITLKPDLVSISTAHICLLKRSRNAIYARKIPRERRQCRALNLRCQWVKGLIYGGAYIYIWRGFTFRTYWAYNNWREICIGNFSMCK